MGLGDLHHTTPKKARILGTVAYLQDHQIPFFKTDIFRYNQVSHARGSAILHQNHERRHLENETRGRPKILSPADVQKMERIIWQYGFQARALTWQGLALEAGFLNLSARTIERAMGKILSLGLFLY